MKKIRLGRTDLDVSAICLGSMTWGSQDTEADGHAQLDHALSRGIDFIDTAEIYPVNPIAKETSGRTEAIIGTWLEKRAKRDDVVIATKVASFGAKAVRDGAPVTPETLRSAVEGSLKRLRTDYIDLYQIHWPNRGSYHFRKTWNYDPSSQNCEETFAHMAECLETLDAMKGEGKIRHFGLSNESAWGTAQWLRLAEAGHGPRAATIQNEYSLLCRYFDLDMSELCVNEDVTLLAYSVLGAGLLGGQYRGGTVIPDGSRRSKVPDLGGRATARVWPAVEAYRSIAAEAGLDPVTMAVAFSMQRPFSCVPILGARSIAQLDPAIDAADLVLDDQIKAKISAAHRAHPMPF
ncbi:aldo/keto reductase [Albirhodobacter sp. R86504]|uniref:aldo/keto reductase n=1 Tax=Albirhodobacter sp. R86504 TaxID=3093848 RepID=UPI00366DB0EF